jgi:hypothetical protein
MAKSTVPADRRAEALAEIRESQARVSQLRERTIHHATQLGKAAEKLRVRASRRR